ncbi:MAG: 30S ribosomal protein S20 [Candidatus Staskawiczbacteria bacterium RIFCSPHIGHO2_02_FULL_43_16]|uniref:Small ribosomal subunit protein bS20 n=1 Tax=Candidatus Staskawiczbacteria bacterium RIFCSPHIGHO2_01_FULL_41_41 TaxID=1802203 RepID=A0A1G2HRT3_9BACT|nr:MAG: 30S ribosomal protein S20 [Candidatus Staskawiczbacteria bacterium RIFCSPHIGHO2_01_FULL_41_41]OGZ68112.1 MAG: 30S ribosomal protein S20 [Candidatus Staskawiczbacteria bacterium RIFCSPHIGHO2_02_FULL_43_16]OGZ74851.1 MAG: 30S ribosomal protein S20 [Candidatus Staskawiczbacteria bacterium RIFCSPLOWO2_01_FULL_43_17b]
MAITASAKKAIRQNKTRRARNLIYINKMKALLKDAKAFVMQKKIKEAKELLPKVYGILDKSAKVGIIKKNNASRRKSRIAKMVDKASK